MAIVSPVGTDIDAFQKLFVNEVSSFGYEVRPQRLSQIAKYHHTGTPFDERTEFARVNSYMDAGNSLRKLAKRGDVLALHAVAAIRKGRDEDQGEPQPIPKVIHFLRSLKHPDEVEALRRVYGAGFFLIGLHATEAQQTHYLETRQRMTPAEAAELIRRDRDEHGEKDFGQHTRDTFTLADIFLRSEDAGPQLSRFLELIFGYPFWTPTLDEHAMFLAHAAALRSGQLARQVGAVVVSATGELISTGANDVPRFGGGLYWPEQDGRPDYRDHHPHIAGDSNDRAIDGMIENILKAALDSTAPFQEDNFKAALQASGIDAAGSEHILKAARENTARIDFEKFKRTLKGGEVGDLTEYGRAVHAEMEALLACARVGVSPRDGTLYTTTFPCHNCTKHLVDAGIRRVVYVEPYPKSKAGKLHNDSIAIDEDSVAKVQFQPFVGVAARRYFDVFSMRLSGGLKSRRKKDNGDLADWTSATARPRLRMAPFSYLQREERAIELITKAVAAEPASPTPTQGGAAETPVSS